MEKKDTGRNDVRSPSRAKWGKVSGQDIESLSERREQLVGISADSANDSRDSLHHDDDGAMEDRGCGGKVETQVRPGSTEAKKLWVMF